MIDLDVTHLTFSTSGSHIDLLSMPLCLKNRISGQIDLKLLTYFLQVRVNCHRKGKILLDRSRLVLRDSACTRYHRQKLFSRRPRSFYHLNMSTPGTVCSILPLMG